MVVAGNTNSDIANVFSICILPKRDKSLFSHFLRILFIFSIFSYQFFLSFSKLLFIQTLFYFSFDQSTSYNLRIFRATGVSCSYHYGPINLTKNFVLCNQVSILPKI